MRVYSPDDAGRLWLSPYTQVNIQPDRLLIHQTLFDRTGVLCCPESFATLLLDALSAGAGEEALLALLTDLMKDEASARELIETWLQIGVIE
ncbi:MAG: hypothetical protein IJ343_11090 [Clostridia bacterium]|nr:hypothetical protein [Clostridia bacterium]